MRKNRRRIFTVLIALTVVASLAGCAVLKQENTKRDKTAKGAAIGAASGAAGALILGERELDEVLLGAAIGAGVGAGIGAYMDYQEEKLSRIPGTTVERVSKDTLLLHFESDILYETGSALLSPHARGTLDEAAGVFLEYKKTGILSQGHTDSRGSEEYNQDLSVRRAEAVRGYLIGRGVDAERVVAVGYGEGFPVASNETDDGRSRNRRVDLLIKAKAR